MEKNTRLKKKKEKQKRIITNKRNRYGYHSR